MACVGLHPAEIHLLWPPKCTPHLIHRGRIPSQDLEMLHCCKPPPHSDLRIFLSTSLNGISLWPSELAPPALPRRRRVLCTLRMGQAVPCFRACNSLRNKKSLHLLCARHRMRPCREDASESWAGVDGGGSSGGGRGREHIPLGEERLEVGELLEPSLSWLLQEPLPRLS